MDPKENIGSLNTLNWQVRQVVQCMLESSHVTNDTLTEAVTTLNDPSRKITFAETGRIVNLATYTDIFSAGAVTCSMYVCDREVLAHLPFNITNVYAHEELPKALNPRRSIICFPGNSWPEFEYEYFSKIYLPKRFKGIPIRTAEPGDYSIWLRKENRSNVLFALNNTSNELHIY